MKNLFKFVLFFCTALWAVYAAATTLCTIQLTNTTGYATLMLKEATIAPGKSVQVSYPCTSLAKLAVTYSFQDVNKNQQQGTSGLSAAAKNTVSNLSSSQTVNISYPSDFTTANSCSNTCRIEGKNGNLTYMGSTKVCDPCV